MGYKPVVSPMSVSSASLVLHRVVISATVGCEIVVFRLLASSGRAYAVFHNKGQTYRGIFSQKDDSAVICSSVPIEAKPIVWMQCNIDAYKTHCRSHREYWQWVSERNEDRYATNTQHGHDYDSKNLMHTLRLLDQATEIVREGSILLPRPNADWLKQVKRGDYTYEDILKIADEKSDEMNAAFDVSSLPDRLDRNLVNNLLLEIRNHLFQK